MRSYKPFFYLLASCLISLSLAVVITDPAKLRTDLTYDYIIVGAGNAGLVLANRLTENANISVLVLEAGVSDAGVVAGEAPFLGFTLTPDTIFDWNYTVVEQENLNERTFPYPRGRVLGGCTAVNYLVHQYGTFEDWDRLAALSNDDGWTWNNMKPYIQRHERFTPPVDGHNTTGQFIPSLHGFNGELSVSLPGFNMTIDQRVINTTKELSEFPFNEDTSGGDQSLLGIGWVQSSAGGGVRSSSSTSYLDNAIDRPNLTVLIHAIVNKLIPVEPQAGVAPAFRRVQFSVFNSSVPNVGPASVLDAIVQANREVILAAGSIGTPQILKLSGIGDPTDLQNLGLPVVVENLNVGLNLSDHILLPNIFSVQGNLSFDHILRNPNSTLNQWLQNMTGVFANNVANNLGFFRISSDLIGTAADPAAGPNSPHWEIVFSNNWFDPNAPPPTTGSFMTIIIVLISPTSRGAVSVQAPTDNPFPTSLINPNYLATDIDRTIMREAFKAAMRFSQASTWSDYIIGPFGASFQAAANTTDDSVIDQYVREFSTTIFHPVGTASMGSFNTTDGVVNPDLTVKGTTALRVVDASVFTFIPSCHPQGAIYLLGERASDIIRISNQCNIDATLLCCSSAQPPTSSTAIILLGLFGIVSSSVTGLVGITCTPITVFAANGCSEQAVCCTNNTFNGVVALGCTPTTLNL